MIKLILAEFCWECFKFCLFYLLSADGFGLTLRDLQALQLFHCDPKRSRLLFPLSPTPGFQVAEVGESCLVSQRLFLTCSILLQTAFLSESFSVCLLFLAANALLDWKWKQVHRGFCFQLRTFESFWWLTGWKEFTFSLGHLNLATAHKLGLLQFNFDGVTCIVVSYLAKKILKISTQSMR